ncbi:MAG: efflux RND transporter periplasmic adaptor subunit [Planctomycetes bacterium]|nr:efflux RND transporter periplasmic adaptor subunit [Planctomycetota bacterium]
MPRCSYSPCLFTLIMLTGCTREPQVTVPPPLEVIVSRPLKEVIEDWDTFTGLVEAKESVEIRPRVRGHIKEVKFKEGAEVKEGDVLFLIDDGPFRAQEKQADGQMKLYTAKLKLAQERIGILEPLVKSGSAAKQELDKVMADQGEAIAGMATAEGQIQEARLNTEYCRIVAPISGHISRAFLTKGNLVNAAGDNLLTTLVSVDPMYVYFHVNERALLRYRNHMIALASKNKDTGKKSDMDIKVQMGLATDRDYPHKGIIDFIDNRVDSSTGTIKVRARFDNPKRADGRRLLAPGMFARIRAAVADPHPAILVADRAILTDQNMKYLLKVNRSKENLVERVDIEAGRLQEDGLRVVDAGLKGDEWIIVDGVTMVRPGVTVTPREGSMPRRPGHHSGEGK